MDFIEEVIPEYKARLELVRNYIATKNIPKNEVLFRAGNISKEMYFVRKGGCVMYTLEGGEEVVSQFFFEGELMCDHFSFLTFRPSNQFIRALEDSELESLSYDDIQYLYDRIPELERVGRILTERICVQLMINLMSYKNDSAEIRYRKLLIQRPALFQRVPQYLIASFLSLTPVGLSKIRKRLTRP
jgi:CRP/FNR family transcriptional regulator, anaerobic regulatory protein